MRFRYGVGLAALVVSGVWLATAGDYPHSQASTPDHPINRWSLVASHAALPPAKSLGDSYATLAGQAAMGNKAAAFRLFNEQAICQGVATLKSRLHEDSYETWLMVHGAWLASRSVTDQVDIKRRVQAKYQALSENKELCTHVDASFNDGRIYDAALLAAKDGDTVATACLIEAPWPTRSMTDTEASTFDKRRLNLAERDIQRGSWAVVSAMRGLYSSTGSANQIPGHSHLNRYDELRMSYLEQIGRQRGGVPNATADHKIELSEIDVTPEDAERARRWASQTYSTALSHAGPPISLGENACFGQWDARWPTMPGK